MDIIQFVAHFHPLIVHLPIGMLVLSFILIIAIRFDKWAAFKPVIPFALFWGALSAIVSCITGYLLSFNGDYNVDLLTNHQWSGIALAGVSTASWAAYRFWQNTPQYIAFFSAFLMTALLMVTGHYGGSMTHGEGYLMKNLRKKSDRAILKENVAKSTDSLQNQAIQANIDPVLTVKDSIKKPNLPIEKAFILKKDKAVKIANTELLPSKNIVEKPIYAYQDLIVPILEKRCYSCHSEQKSKGGLRLDTPEFIKKGGDEGLAVVAGEPDKSYMYSSLILPLEDDYHMPPEGKPQLTQEQIQLIHWWILNGASFDKTVDDINGGKKMPESMPDSMTSKKGSYN